jgi:transposase
MYIETVRNRNSPPCVLLRQSYREDGKVKKRTITNLTSWPGKIVEGLRTLLKGGVAVDSGADAFEVTRSLPHGHVLAVTSTLKRLKLHSLIGRGTSKEKNISLAMIAARILNPQSKLATSRDFRRETASNSLGDECGLDVDEVSERDLYEAMDWLLKRQESIERQLASRHLKDGTFVLYDLTSTYFEGTKCPLAKLGHNRDKKKGKLQIEIGLLCDRDGRPVAVEVFEGNTGDPSTVSTQVEKLRERFNLKRVVVVGDRGMLTEARIREELRPVDGLDWISALRGPAIKKLVEGEHLQLSLFDEKDLAEITSPDYPGERLVVCRNPQLAWERAEKRENLLKATERELDKIVKATRRKRNPLKGKSGIGVKVGAVVNKYKVAKHFNLKITCKNLTYQRKTENIQKEAMLDGFYAVRTSVEKSVLDDEKVVETYKRLSVVERAFRTVKGFDLKVRPIFHRLPNRVKSHVLICFLAYYVEWHMRKDLAPILFEDEEKELAAKARRSVVAPAQRSESAKRKDATKRSEDDLPVHNFKTLLDDLATIVKNTMRMKMDGAPLFQKITTPTIIQRRALDLLGVKI